MSLMNISESIKDIGKFTVEKLSRFKIPPYPKYYSQTFVDLLYERGNEELVEFFNKNPHYFFYDPRAEDMLQDALFIARDSVNTFEDCNENLQSISSQQVVELEKYDINSDVNSEELVSVFKNFQEKISDHMQDSKKHIQELKEKIESLENGVNLNPVTKIPNGVEFQKYMQDVFRAKSDRELDLYLVAICADNFKKISSSYGRLAGDKTIFYLSTLLKNSLRSGTRIYHIKHDEFYVVLNRIKKEQSISMVQRVIQEVAKSKLFYKGNNITLTVSSGVVKHNKNDDMQSILDRLNRTLNEAKKTGNCYKEEI